MKVIDFWLQLCALLLYVIVSPVLFGVVHPSSGDVSLIWIWVFVVTGLTSLISIGLGSILNVFVSPRRTFKFKVLLPLGISHFLMYRIGSGLEGAMEMNFILMNICLLLVLYLGYGIAFVRKTKTLQE